MYIYQAIGNLAPILRAFAKKAPRLCLYPDQPFALNTMQKGEKGAGQTGKKQDEKGKSLFPSIGYVVQQEISEKGGGVNGLIMWKFRVWNFKPREQRRAVAGLENLKKALSGLKSWTGSSVKGLDSTSKSSRELKNALSGLNSGDMSRKLTQIASGLREH